MFIDDDDDDNDMIYYDFLPLSCLLTWYVHCYWVAYVTCNSKSFFNVIVWYSKLWYTYNNDLPTNDHIYINMFIIIGMFRVLSIHYYYYPLVI